MAPNTVGRTLARGLGINVDYRKEEQLGSGAVSISSVQTCKHTVLRISVATMPNPT